MKKMSFQAVLGDLDIKSFLVAQSRCPTFNISFAFIFVRKTHKLFLKC